MTSSTIEHLQTLFDAGTFGGAPDRLLLERFAANRDSLAFETIVARHGPMVLGVCGRILNEPSDVEDAFQATFLILVRKAGALRDRDRLRNWLYGVAQRVAQRARVNEARRRLREHRAPRAAPVVSLPSEAEHRELLAVLHEELDRLPEKHRAAIVLCDLENLTCDEAARELGYALGTLKTRLATGRKRLRERLIRRGIAPATGALVTGVAASSTRAAVPAQLLARTVAAALQYASNRAAVCGGALSATVLTLTEGVLFTMWLYRVKIVAAAALLAVAACAGSLGVLAQQPAGNKYDESIRQLEERLRMLKELRRQEAEHAAIQARAADQLRKLRATVESDVVAINLAGTSATDHDMKLVAAFPNLLTLHLHHTKVTDAGLASLKGLKNLTTLDMFDTQITDRGLEHLAEWMPHLEWLELSDTEVTDACLKSFERLKNLRRLDVRKTRVTEAGVQEFRRAMPGVEVLR